MILADTKSCRDTSSLLKTHLLAMCTKTYRIVQEERALGMHNLRFVPKFCDFFSCRPAKYTRLPVQQVKTREKQFPLVKFDARYKASLVCG